jgi:hypothetical protein
MLMKLGRSTVRTADLHPYATTAHDEMEEEVKPATATLNTMIQRCEDLNIIYEKKDEFSEIALTLVQD